MTPEWVGDLFLPQDVPAYSIRTAAGLIGVGTRRLRDWERLGLLRPARSRGKHRRYSLRDVERAGLIRRLREQGVSIDGIKALLTRRDRMRRRKNARKKRR